MKSLDRLPCPGGFRLCSIYFWPFWSRSSTAARRCWVWARGGSCRQRSRLSWWAWSSGAMSGRRQWCCRFISGWGYLCRPTQICWPPPNGWSRCHPWGYFWAGPGNPATVLLVPVPSSWPDGHLRAEAETLLEWSAGVPHVCGSFCGWPTCTYRSSVCADSMI